VETELARKQFFSVPHSRIELTKLPLKSKLSLFFVDSSLGPSFSVASLRLSAAKNQMPFLAPPQVRPDTVVTTSDGHNFDSPKAGKKPARIRWSSTI
jgi:hypothetical protein